MQRAKEDLEKRKRKVNAIANKALKQEPCDQNAPVIKCQVSYFNLLNLSKFWKTQNPWIMVKPAIIGYWEWFDYAIDNLEYNFARDWNP